jgi:hypothetical protein
MPFDPSKLQYPPSARSDGPMSADQMVQLKTLAKRAYELDAFRPQLTSAEAARRIAMLAAKLKLLGDPPHTL